MINCTTVALDKPPAKNRRHPSTTNCSELLGRLVKYLCHEGGTAIKLSVATKEIFDGVLFGG